MILLVLELHIPESQICFGVTKIASEFFIANAPFLFRCPANKGRAPITDCYILC